MIVGAGLAGLSAAKELAQRGFSPLVLESEGSLGKKPCGELAGREVFGYNISEFISNECIRTEFKRFFLIFGNKKSEIRDSNEGFFKFPKLLMINRKKAQKELSEGIDIRFNYKVEDILYDKDIIILNNEIRTKFLMGADGVNSVVRKSTNQKTGRTALAIQSTAETDIEDPYMRFDPKISGCEWSFPSNGIANIGVGGFKIESIKERWREIKDEFEMTGKPAYHPIHMDLPYNIIFKNSILIGDAGGFCMSLFGSGINSSLVSGKIAGKTFPNTGEYSKKIKKTMFPKLRKQYIYSKLFYNVMIKMGGIPALILRCPIGIERITSKKP